MKITYKQQTFDHADIRLIKNMAEDECLTPPRLSQLAAESDHPNWRTFFQKFRDVGGFDNYAVTSTDQDGLTDVHNWLVNQPVADQIFALWANPPEEPYVDHVQQTTRWFRSQKWFVPIWLLFVAVTAIIGCLTLVRMLLDLFKT